MRNYQLRKTNNKITLKKFFSVNNKWGEVGAVYICTYDFVLCFGVTVLIFPNSKKKSKNKIKLKLKKIGNSKSKKSKAFIHIFFFLFNVLVCVCVSVCVCLFLTFIYFSC